MACKYRIYAPIIPGSADPPPRSTRDRIGPGTIDHKDRDRIGMSHDDSIEVFTSALGMFGEVPVTVETTRGVYTHEKTGVEIRVPDTESGNWGLQADGVWQAAVYLVDHLPRPLCGKRVLELGAAAGLPGIVSAFGDPNDEPESVTLSDYPDQGILSQLERNVKTNRGSSRVRVDIEGHAWGSTKGLEDQFDVVLAADVLWVETMHEALCDTLDRVLAPSGQVHIVAGLHTGRGVITSFLSTAAKHSLYPRELYQIRITDPSTKHEWTDWVPGETMDQRRGWLVVAVLLFVHV